METTFIVNGEVTLILTPQTEMDRILLQKLVDKPVEVKTISQPVGILASPVKDSVMITAVKYHGDDTNKI
jgi:hypothetical protein